ncbi:MAG: DegT/DnrJ/EryC1/StrS family aminotransferase [Gammaproteobacteria bacterium]|nr:DegT/DnrJ/EryC1/StrS family aminotransferase [Gammaproteobacteria bacterium]
MIPMVDLKGQYQSLKEEIDRGLLDALNAAQFILGPNVRAFEEEAADYLGCDHAVGVASGTDALHLGLIAAGISAGDEVITTPFTFIATAEAISYIGATPIFVDIDPHTFNIDLTAVEAAITPKTRAILPVHIFGQPVAMEGVMALAEAHQLQVIEDCAQSFGAAVNGKMTGTIGTVGCFSFFPSKNLGGYGDGGLITTSSEEIAQHLRVLRNHGSWKQYHHSELGFNSRLDELQAVILRAKLKRMDSYSEGRRRVAHHYSAALQQIDGVTPPYEDGIGTHVYHQYTVLSQERQKIQDHLRSLEIASAIYYPIPLHLQPVYADLHRDQALPIAEMVASNCLSLPIFPEMESSQVKAVLAAIGEAVAN